ncbi:chemotaxis protein CheW [Sorangium sp. So ce375]|uniref:chemotaxis protein CheA n=1 Tax=Sorangium sp. So ce375 TaxID=3133306 RepID=UPI003F5B2449
MDADQAALMQMFAAETAEHLDELEASLLELERRPDAGHLLERIFRVTHTMKGNASSVGVHGLSELSHAAEDVIEDLHRGTLPVTGMVVSLLLETVDSARRLLAELDGGEEPPTSTPLPAGVLDRLRSARRAGREGTPSTPRGNTPGAADEGDRSAGDRSEGAKTVRITVEKLDCMVDLIGEVSVTRNRIARDIQLAGGAVGAAVRDGLEELDRLSTKLEEAIRRARMVPVGPWFRQYERAVRDLARSHGKLARLVVVHGDVEVDTAVIERLRDVLTHLIRNGIDHGLEPPEARKACGKDPRGTITLRATHEGGGIALRISDDGAGMNRARIAARASAQGRSTDAESLSDSELYSLVFEPGFSTAAAVSDLSGRGMGMDVVRRRVESLEGSIRIESAAGVGTTLTLRLPLTLATIEGFSVSAAGERYVVPLRAVVACVGLPRGAHATGAGGVLHVHGRALPCVRLRDLFALSGPAPDRESVVVVAHEGGQAGLVVDSLDGEGRTVIKPLGRLFRRTRGITGSTVLGDGRLALILDVDALLNDLSRGRSGGGELPPRDRWRRAPALEPREGAMDPEGRTR